MTGRGHDPIPSPALGSCPRLPLAIRHSPFAIRHFLSLLLPCLLTAATWIETTGPDFADGHHQANLYASMRDGGAVEFVPRFDYNNDGWIDVACPDDSGPYLHLHLGSLTGFNVLPVMRYEIPGGGGVAGADLDTDGYTDLIHSGWITGSIVIYWGTPVGPSQTDTTWLTVLGRAEAVHIHDLDRDSYLDIITGNTAQSLQIFWGSNQGYSNSDQTTIQLDGSIGHNFEIADFDQDGWADIAVVPWTRNLNPIVYWGPNRTPRDTVWLPVTDSNPHGITTADLDADGWLDLVYTHYDDTTIAYIYYGGAHGFTVEQREIIHPGLCYGGSAAAHWDEDSTLDLVFFRGNFGRDTLLLPRAYYNRHDTFPHYSDDRAVDIGVTALNASGGLIADFNHDGDVDIYLDGYNEGEPSYVLWGPDWTTSDSLACDKSHHGTAREPGNIYDRRFREEYTSSVFNAGSTQVWLTCSWDDMAPPGSGIAIRLRTGDTQAPDSTWTDWLELTSGDSLPDSIASRYIQYAATFTYETPATLPLLEEIRIEYIAWPRHDVGAQRILAPLGAVDSGTVHTPRATVHNYGNRDETFPITFRITPLGGGPDYDQTIQATLPPGATDTLSFPDWTALVVGTYNTLCFTALAGDEKPANDTVADTVRVLDPPKPDVGPTRILAPAGTVDSGTVILPRVEVRNYGPFDVEYPVTFRIGTGYSETITDSLLIGQVDTVQFPQWTAPQVMTLATLCFTSLAQDGNRLNDTIADSVRITRPPPPDVGVTEILAPGPAPDSGNLIAPRAVIHNFGPYTNEFPVTLTIAPGHGANPYEATLTGTLAPGTYDTLTFPDWTAQPVGSLAVVAYTQLARDGDRSNDTTRAHVVVLPYPVHDVGTEALLEPITTLEARDTTKPRARIRNHGNRVERYFDVRFRVGAVYSHSVIVEDDLPPGATREILFPQWVATGGQHVVSCSTALVTDEDTSNDKKTLDLTVIQPYRLHVEPDSTGTIPVGETRTWRLWTELESDTGLVLELPPVNTPPGWTVGLYDVPGTTPLPETLGYLTPYVRREFSLKVTAPPPNLSGIRDSTRVILPVVGVCRGAPALTDTARLTLTLIPWLTIHNYPNPFHSHTSFVIGLPEDGDVSLTIYTRAGELVTRLLDSEPLATGVNVIDWDATNDAGNPVGSGTYQYRFIYVHGDAVDTVTKKLVVTRE